MGKYIVHEVIDHRIPSDGDLTIEGGVSIRRARGEGAYALPILRRLTDEEVDQRLVAATRTIAIDSDRARFIRDTAALFMARLTGDVDECVAEAVHAAESLAAKVFGA